MFKYFKYGVALASLGLPLLVQAEQCSSGYLKTCDVTITRTPTFVNQCFASIQQGLYTIRNNTPATLKLNYIQITPYDRLPESATSIVAAPTNNCGTSLPAGASCNILVNVISLGTVGTFNRVLEIGIDSRQIEVDATPITSSILNCDPPPPVIPPAPTPGPDVPPPPAPTLFQATILGGSTVTNTPITSAPTTVNGDVDVSPGTAITGFPPGVVRNGSLHFADAIANTAHADAVTYYNSLRALPCTTNLTGQDLGGKTLAPGVYCFNTSAGLTGALTLNGGPGSSYTFQIGSTLTTASGSSVVLAGGVLNSNVNWQVGSSATLGTGTAFKGIIVAQASITMTTGVSLAGRAWALDGAVTLDQNVVNPAM